MGGGNLSSALAKESENAVYQYPIVPGTIEWVNFTTQVEKVNACQIPSNTLKKMSTDNLIETVLNYPLFMNVYAFNTLEKGLEVISKDFNGLQELYTRKDGIKKLVEKYNSLDIETPDKSNNVKKSFELTNLELILTSNEISDKMTYSENLSFAKAIDKQEKVKNSNPTLYPLSLSVITPKTTKAISAFSSGVKTPKGSNVTVTVRSEMDSSAISHLNQTYDNLYPNATRRASASNKYNCHNYAWNQINPQSFWMDDPSIYWKDKSYLKTNSGPEWVGNFAYYDSNHSGIVNKIDKGNIEIVSKWGAAGVYAHSYNDCPYLTTCDKIFYYKKNYD